MALLPSGFVRRVDEIRESVRGVEGFLTDREIEFLALLAACPTANGEILEIGTFRGKSTIVLSKAASIAGSGRVVAVDPLDVSVPPFDGTGQSMARSTLDRNFRQAGIAEQVEFHQMKSAELGKTWRRAIRLLWIDGDHSYQGARTDFDSFAHHFADRAVIAFHDILNRFGCIGVFIDCVLNNPSFGPVGMCGSIGWAQYSSDAERCQRFAAEKRRLRRQLELLAPFSHDEARLTGLRKLHFQWRRAAIPHRRINPVSWTTKVA